MARQPTHTETLRTRISPNLHDQLKTIADRDERTVSDLVRHVLADFARREQRRTRAA